MSAPSPRIALITPPLLKPCEPGLSGAAAVQELRRRGVDAFGVEAAIGWFRHQMAPAALEAALAEADRRGHPDGKRLAFRRAARAMERDPHDLRCAATYADRRHYSSAIGHLLNAYRLASAPHVGTELRVADVEVRGRRPHSAADVAAVAARPGPFDDYYVDALIPHLATAGVSHVGVSLTYYHQVFPVFRLARLLAERLPGVTRVLGGPLVDCLRAVGADLAGAPFSAFDRVSCSADGDLEALARELGGQAEARPGLLSVDLDEIPWGAYLSPEPIVPAALGRGCYWRRCAFCPDYLHPPYRTGSKDHLAEWLRALAARFPEGAMVHLCDSALPPARLAHVARVIREDRLPLRWHGFVRMEAAFAEPGFARDLAAGGCAMLQFGLESASDRLLEQLDKGQDAARARRVLRATHAAGIRNHAYLLFGLPTETDEDREATLAFVEAEAHTLHDLNNALFNLPRQSPMALDPAAYGITEIIPFGPDTDLSLYDDFRSGASHPRVEARRWLDRRFFKSAAVRGLLGGLSNPFKANHACFL